MSRREDAATATVGLTGVAGAAATREHLLRRAYRQAGVERKKPPGLLMVRSGGKLPKSGRLRAAYAGTLVAGALAGVPAVSGTANLLTPRRVSKVSREDRVKEFIGTGVKGSGQALRAKATNVREPVPTRYRAGQAAAGVGAGALGAQLTHAALNRAGRLGGGRSRAAATAIGATLTGAATLPATSAGIRRASHGQYRATPTGVVRTKTVRKPASSKASLYQRGRPVPRGFEPTSKALRIRVDALRPVNPNAKQIKEAYRAAGLRTSSGRLRTLGPDEVVRAQHDRQTRIWRSGFNEPTEPMPKPRSFSNALDQHLRTRGPRRGRGYQISKADPKTGYEHVGYKGRLARVYVAGAVPGPLGPINAARQSGRMVPKSQQRSATNTQYGLSQGGRYAGMAAGAYGAAALAHQSKKVAEQSEKYKGKLDQTKAAVTGRVPGYAGAKRLAGEARQRVTPKPRPGGPRRAGRLIARAAAPLARQKSAAALGALVGGSVLGGAGTVAATRISYDKERRARAAGTARHGSRVAKADTQPGLTRRQTREQLKRKQRNIVLGTASATTGLGALAALGGSVAPKVPGHVKTRLARYAAGGGAASAGLGGVSGLDSQRIARRDLAAQRKAYKLMPVEKAADPIKTYGDRGPLPKGLPREEKMRAYEARVAHHGGRKQKKWNRRANVAEVARNVGLVGLTGAAGVALTGRSKRVANVVRRTPVLRRGVDNPKVHERGKTLAEASGVLAGGSELAGEYARHKRGSYSSSPGGAAQSALTRMRANTPGGAR